MIFRSAAKKFILFVPLFTVCALARLPNFSVETLPQYDELFCRKTGWTGADAVYSVALNDTVTLCLFSDTWIGDVVDEKHKDATMVNNSIALQNGRDASKVSIEFFWATKKDGKPAAFITPDDGTGWFWMLDGLVADGKLYIFLMQTVKTDEKSVFGFKQVGTWLGEIENPNDDPHEWRIKQYKVPFGRYSKNGNLFFGSALMRDSDYIYIYGSNEDWNRGMGGRSMIVARVPYSKMTDFGQWRFLSDDKWQADMADLSELFSGSATEYSISYQLSIKQYVAVYTENGMSKNILMRFSPTPVGPWSVAQKVYKCPEVDWHKTYFCYAAKAHPEVSGQNDLIITYVCNSTDFWKMAADSRIYRPRFLRIRFDVQAE
jgi:hypothetical protein